MIEYFNSPTTCYALERIRSDRLLYNKRVMLSALVNESLPLIWPSLQQLDCSLIESKSDLSEIHLLESGDSLIVSLKAPLPHDRGSVFHLGSIPTVMLLAHRCICDYEIWNRLLSESQQITLAGSTLTLDRYCQVGRVIARRARGLGMLVYISDSDPRHRLEALNDGFDLACHQTEIGGHGIHISVCSLLAELDCSSVWQKMLFALQDEMTAACVIALAVLDCGANQAGVDKTPEWWSSRCDRLIIQSCLAARHVQDGSDLISWNTSR